MADSILLDEGLFGPAIIPREDRPMRLFPRYRRLGLLLILSGCVVVAMAGASALDRARQASRALPASADARPGSPLLFMRPDLREDILKPGTAAPPLVLTDFRTGRRVSLDDFRGDRPVVLMFGSVDLPLFDGQLGTLRRLHDDFKGRVAFLFIEIVEPAHPESGLEPLAERPGPEASSPEVRRRRIAKGLEVEDVPFPCLVDEDGRAEVAYAAHPLRLVVVGTDGLILYNAGLGRLLFGPAVVVSPTGGLVPYGLGSEKAPPSPMTGWDLKVIEECLRADLATEWLH
jgi:hypothetical protein